MGHLFQGRYKTILIEKETGLLELCRYVVLNPLRVKAHAKINHWKWSSYQATAGMVPVPEFLTVEWVLSQLGKSRSAALAGYRAFARQGLEKPPMGKVNGEIYLGSDSFVEKHAHENKKQTEIPRVPLQAARPSLQQIFNRRRGKNAIEVAYTNYGYRMKDIAEHLGMHYATVSRRLRKLEQEKRIV